jgi:succinate dehydrogenase/fumarate reductase cytochrome b subunit
VEPAAPATRATGGALDRWFELTSVVPLAGFVLVHVGGYARILFGANELGARRSPSAVTLTAEALLVWLPFAFHVALAPSVWSRRQRYPAPAPSERATLALHRGAGVVLGAFLLDHFVRFRLPILRGERYPAEALPTLAAELSRTTFGIPLVASLHALAILALAFHLGHGLLRITARHPRLHDNRLTAPACITLALTTAVLGTLTVIKLAAG